MKVGVRELSRWFAAILLGAGLAAQKPEEAAMIEGLRRAREAAGFKIEDSVGVFVGVNEFVDSEGKPRERPVKLDFAVDDAIDLAHAFCVDRELIRADRIRLVLSGEPVKEATKERLAALVKAGAQRRKANREGIQDAIEIATSRAGEGGVFVFAASSHGVSSGGNSVLLACDSRLDRLAGTAIPLNAMLDRIKSSKARRGLVLIDACRDRVDGTKAGNDRYTKMQSQFWQSLAEARGLAVLCGTVLGGVSFEDRDARNGVFTSRFLEGLAGGAAGDARGLITVRTLAEHTSDGVRQFIREKRRDYADTCTGILFRAEDVRVSDLPLAVNAAAFAKAVQRSSESASRAETLRAALDFTVITGDLVQQVYAALAAAQGEGAKVLGDRIDQLGLGGKLAARDFAQWWRETGAARFLPDTARSAGGGTKGASVRPGSERLDNADTDTNDTLGGASKISVMASFDGRVGVRDDRCDFYSFVPEADGVFTFTVHNREEKGGTTASLAGAVLLDEAGDLLHSIHYSMLKPASGGSSEPVAVAAGRPYSIGIEPTAGHTVAYSVACKWSPLPDRIVDTAEPNGAVGPAAPEMDLVKGVTATVGFGDDQLDVYRIVAPADGILSVSATNRHVRATANGALNTIAVVDAHKAALADIHYQNLRPTGSGASAPFAVARDEIYYVAVAPSKPGCAAPYQLNAQFEAFTILNDPQRNDSAQQAVMMRVGEDRRDLVGFGSDPVDYYRLEPTEDGMLEVAVRNLHPRIEITNGGLQFAVLNAKQEPVGGIHWQSLGPAKDAVCSFSVIAGEPYFFRIDCTKPTSAAPYLISVRRP